MSESGDYIFVNYASTNDVYDALCKAQTQMAGVIADLESSINQLLANQWMGKSADVWQPIQKGWNQRIADMNQDLANNSGILNEMSGNYSTTDNNLAGQWEDISLS
jgi:WXG100 family type VII secretion target